METTATRATLHDDTARPQHVHSWGAIQHESPPAYLVTAHGPRALAGMDGRFRTCTGLGCSERVCGTDVEHPEVLAHLAARSASTSATT
jgi:hypothetical protein